MSVNEVGGLAPERFIGVDAGEVAVPISRAQDAINKYLSVNWERLRIKSAPVIWLNIETYDHGNRLGLIVKESSDTRILEGENNGR